MEVSSPVNAAPFIKIEQLVKHDVWDIRKKDDGAFVMKKLNESGAGASATNTELGRSAGGNTNHEQLGARPKITVQVPQRNSLFTINAVNTPPKNEGTAPKNSTVATNTVSNPKKEVITINTAAATPKVLTMKTITDPKKDVITIKTSVPPKEVITINAAPTQKREVIRINTTAPKKGLITMHTASASSNTVVADTKSEPKIAAAAPSQAKDKFSFNQQGQHAEYDTWDVETEVLRVQEMFPAVPRSVILNDLKTTGSAQDTIENILDGKFDASASTCRSDSFPHNDKGISYQSANKEKKAPEVKKSGTLIKIELLARNEVWDIRKKDKEGFVMKKILPGIDDSQSQCNQSANSKEAMEDECDDLLLADDRLGDYKVNPEQVDGPVKLMVYSQSSNKNLPGSSKNSTGVSGAEKMGSSMDIDHFDADDLCPEEKAPLSTFDFSDDENEEGETVEQFLFKASLVLSKVKCLNESENQKGDNSVLLNITGSLRSEETSDTVVEEDQSDDDDDDDNYYTDECYTDEGE